MKCENNNCCCTPCFSFVFSKIDEITKCPLECATFELRKCCNVVATAKSNRLGKVCFKNIPKGNYTMVESISPIGYKKNSDIYCVDVMNNGVVTINCICAQNFVVTNTPIKNTHTMTYHDNTEGRIKTFKVEHNATHIVIENPFQSPHEHVEWNTESGGTGKAYHAGDSIVATNDMMMYARWKTVIPVMNDIFENDEVINGTGVVGAEIIVTLPNGKKYADKVNEDKTWAVKITENLEKDQSISAIQTVLNMQPSNPVIKKVQEGPYFDVTYYTNGGSDEESHIVKVKENTNYTIATNMFHSIHTFIEWNEKSDGTGKVYKPGDQVKVTKNMALYARWKTVKPTIKDIHAEDQKIEGTGLVGGIINVKFPSGNNKTATVAADMTWSVSVTEVIKAGEIVGANQTVTGMQISDFVFKTVQEETYYNVTYYTNGGSLEEPKIVKVKANTNYNIDANMFTSVHTFIEWNTVSNGTGKVYHPGDQVIVTENIFLFARWKTVKPIVNDIFVGDAIISGTGELSSEIRVTFPSGKVEATKVSAQKTWSIPVSETLQKDQVVSIIQAINNLLPSDPVTKTVLDKTYYNVKYYPNGGSTEAPHIVKVEANTNYTVAANMFTSIHTFIEWNTLSNGTGKVYQPGNQITVKENVVLYARWKTVIPVMSDVHMEDDKIKGTGEAGAEISVTLPSGSKHTTIVLEDKTWSVPVTEKLTKDATISATQTVSNMLVSDVITKIVQEGIYYSVMYYSNGGSTEAPHIVKVKANENYSVINNMFTSIHEFENWNDKPDGTGRLYNPGDQITVTADIRLFARWRTVKPVMNDIHVGDTTIKGTGIVNAEIIVTLPNGRKEATRVAANKTWTVSFEEILQKDQIVSAIQTVTNMSASEAVTKIVLEWVYYNVTYYTNGGSNEEPHIVKAEANKLYAIADNMFTSIHTFFEWNEKADGRGSAYKPGEKVTITKDMALYARWKTINPVVNDIHVGDTTVYGIGIVGADINVVFPGGTKQTAKVTADKTWSVPVTEALQQNQVVNCTQTVTNMLPSDPVVKIVMEAILYNVTYYANGGSTETPHIVKVRANTNHTIEDNMFKSVHLFIEWNTVSNGTGKKYSPGEQLLVTENISLFAIWKTVKPVIDDIHVGDATIHGTGETGAEISVSLPSGKKETAKVVGDKTWSVPVMETLQSGQTVTAIQTVTNMLPSDLVTKIVSDRIYYTVTYYPNGGSTELPIVVKVNQNANYTILANMFTSIHTFVEWNEKADGTGKVYKPGDQVTVTENISLFARWKAIEPDVDDIYVGDAMVSGEGEAGAEIIVTFPSGKKETTKVTEEEIWSVSVTETLIKEQVITTTQTVSNMLPSDPVSTKVLEWIYCNVTYYPNGGSTEAPHVVKVKENSPYVIEANLFKSVHTFIEWNEKADGTGKVYKPGDDIFVIENMSLYARWKVVVPTLNDINIQDTVISGTGEIGAQIQVTFPLGLKKYATVAGDKTWSIPVTGKLEKGQTIEACQIIANMVTSDSVFKKVEDNEYYHVTYYPNGGSNEEPNIVKVNKNTMHVIKANMFKSVHTFIEWNETSDGTGKAYHQGEQVTVTADMKLYARWKTAVPDVKVIRVNNTIINGTGVVSAEVQVTFPSGKKVTTKVLEDRKWSVPVTEKLEKDQIVTVIQTVTNMLPSNQVIKKVLGLPLYEVVYNPNAGSEEESHRVKVEETTVYTIENNMFKSVHTFIEWNTKADGSGTKYHSGDKITIKETIYLYAMWKTIQPGVDDVTEASYVVSGTGIPYANISVTLPSGIYQVQVSRYEIWTIELNPQLKKGDIVSVTQRVNGILASDPVVKVVTEPILFNVTYHPNGGSTEQPYVEKANKEFLYYIAKNKFTSIHTFSGWNTNPDGTGTAYQPDNYLYVKSDMNLYAQFKTIQPVVNDVYEDSTVVNGTGEVGAQVSVTFPSSVKEVTIVAVDKTWSVPISQTLRKGQTIKVDQKLASLLPSDPVIKTVLENASYNVTYYPNGGSNESPHVTKVKANCLYAVEANMFHSTHTFIEWNDKEDGTGTAYQPNNYLYVKSDMDLYAQFKTIQPVVNDVYEDDTSVKGTGEVRARVSVALPSGVNEYSIVAANKTWSVPIPETLRGGQTIKVDQKLIKLLLSDPVVKTVIGNEFYNITYYPNLELIEVPHIVAVEANKPYIIATNMFTSIHTFIEWNEKSDGSGKVYKPGDQVTVTNNMSMYARWKTIIPVVNDIHESENQISGTGEVGAEISVVFPSGKQQTTIVEADKAWHVSFTEDLKKDEIVSSIQTVTNMLPSDPVTKKVLDRIIYDVTYYPNGGSSEQPHVIKVKANNFYTVEANMFHSTHTFIEWNDKEDGTGTKFKHGEEIFITANRNLYAMWKSFVPLVNSPRTSGKEVSGTGIPGSKIESKYQDETATGTVPSSGYWIVKFKFPFEQGYLIETVQIQKNMLPSDKVNSFVRVM